MNVPFASFRNHDGNCRCISGATIPSPADTTSIRNEASPDEYQLSCAKAAIGERNVRPRCPKLQEM
jgi:hypothetical protein